MDEGQRPHVPRAPRFAIAQWVLYRPAETPAWYGGRIENISRTGVLFTAEELIDPNTAIEMLLAMPLEVAGGAAGTTRCLARVVRAEGPPTPGDRPLLAAAILKCDPIRLPDGI